MNAQIGYQVSLLNSATGEPRANETVSVTVEITNSESSVICTETKSAPRHNNSRKYLHNDQVLVENANRTYPLTGQELK